MKSERIQAWSRALIFFGIVMLATVMAGIFSSVAGMLLFGETPSVMPGGALPTDAASWWNLHMQSFISQAIGFGGAVFICRAMWNGAVPTGVQVLPGTLSPTSIGLILLMVFAYGPLMAVSYELNVLAIPEGSVLESMFKPLEDMLEQVTAFLVKGSGIKKVVILISVALVPAVFEELAFRGALQPLLIRATGKAWIGILLASIIFSAIHFQFYGFLPRMLLGLLFGWLAYRSSSIIPGMIAHFLNNAGAAVTFWVTGSMADDVFPLETWTVLLSLLLTAGAIVGYDRVLRNSRPAETAY